jgi:hypothetical protein
MNASCVIVGTMHGPSQLTCRVSRWIAAAAILSLAAFGQSLSADGDASSVPESLLSRNVIVPLAVVHRFFPEVTRETSTGHNVTAVGNTQATRSVIYANSDNSNKVTITVDQYAGSTEASSAYQEAVQRSRNVPGFKPLSAANLGQNAFIGTVTQGAETHIGIGALHGGLIVGVTLVGYDPTPGNVTKLLSLTREEEAVAKAVLDGTTHR